MPLATKHRIDADERICYVDEEFRLAAAEAGVPELPDRALGTPLLDHFAGEPTKRWYRHILDHVKRHGTASFEFRCDTPTLYRLQRMEVRRLDGGTIEFGAVTLSTSPRPYVQVLDRSIPHGTRRVIMCSWCLRVQSVIGWVDVAQAAQVLQVFQESVPPSIEYEVCEEDRDRLKAMLRERLK